MHVWRKFHWGYIRNNPQSVSFTLVVYLLVTGFLFVSRWFAYRCTNPFLAQARACGQVLNFHCAFILIMILRKTITTLRVSGLGRYLPLDHYVYFHKLTGWVIAFFSLWHTMAHLGNFKLISNASTIPYGSLLFSPFLGIGWIAGTACISGWLLCLVLTCMLVFSMNFIRRSGKFEVFYYSHKLYIVFFICLFVHAPNCWKWLAIPMILYSVECIARSFKTKKDQHGLTYIVEGTILPSRVICLLIRKPIYFTFTPGDFVYVMMPFITRHEWHPITISSAPEDRYITVHIRAVGEWTNHLYEYFALKEFHGAMTTIDMEMDVVNQNNNCHSNESQLQSSLAKTYKDLKISAVSYPVFLQPLKIHLDGPYGAPYSNIFQTEHAFLIATGIGVTPFASILQSIIYRHSAEKNPLKYRHWGMEKPPLQQNVRLKKVDFVWINRDHSSFEWFVEKLVSLNDQQVRQEGQQFLEIHMYVTGKERDLAKYGNSLNWHSGRPHWESLFQDVRNQNRGKVTVFYCGRPDLGKVLRSHCSHFRFGFRKEVF